VCQILMHDHRGKYRPSRPWSRARHAETARAMRVGKALHASCAALDPHACSCVGIGLASSCFQPPTRVLWRDHK
jgi:hypothetical protein